MEARYKFDEESEGEGVVTSITFGEDEIGDLIDALDEVGVVGVVGKQKGKSTPILGQLLHQLEYLQEESENEGGEETCSECGQEIEEF